ncbi:hypothetical protein C8R45DRAFT_932063 [Mycena sanguinolenta]|nr:hypothetical protein C8R45DRAFT_932063 [Mycena sanguinolenta]
MLNTFKDQDLTISGFLVSLLAHTFAQISAQEYFEEPVVAGDMDRRPQNASKNASSVRNTSRRRGEVNPQLCYHHCHVTLGLIDLGTCVSSSNRRDSQATSNRRDILMGDVGLCAGKAAKAKDSGPRKLRINKSGSAPLVVDCLGQNIYPTMNALQVAIRTEYRRGDDQDGDDNTREH